LSVSTNEQILERGTHKMNLLKTIMSLATVHMG